MADEVTFRVFRGEPDEDGDPFGEMVDYTVEMDEKRGTARVMYLTNDM